MASLAKVTLVGNLGRDAELRVTPRGMNVLDFSIATNEKWNDAQGVQQEATTWFRVSLWGKQADTLKTFLTKGKQVLVEGRLRVREYTDRDGNRRTSLDVRCDTILLLGGRGMERDESAGGGAPAELERHDPSYDDQDIPF
jgi:single-strand DNA-binding protein